VRGCVLEQLDIVWTGIRPYYTGVASLSCPAGDPNLLGSYSCWLIGHFTELAGYEGVPQGNIYFAGEHTSYNFQGYMEGGAQTGVRAANEVAVALVGPWSDSGTARSGPRKVRNRGQSAHSIVPFLETPGVW